MTKLLQVGDRVRLTSSTMMDDEGKTGVVTRKYVPGHCTGVWSLTVRWDGNRHETSYPYPSGGLVEAMRVAEYDAYRNGR